MRIHSTKIGHCCGCGLGVTLPNREPWRPGAKVVVMPEEDLLAILREKRAGAGPGEKRGEAGHNSG